MLSLCLAVTGLVIIDVYRQSLAEMIRQQGRKILTADMTLSARRQLTADELRIFRETLPPGTQFSEIFEMMGMVSSAKESRLAMLRFVDGAYPLVGDMQPSSMEESGHGSDLKKPDGYITWVAPDLLALMSVETGETLKIGQIDVQIADVMKKDSSQTLRFGGLAPRIYLAREALEASKLMQFGTTFTHTIMAAGPGLTPALKAKLEKQLTDPSVEVTLPRDLERGALRVLTRVLDYLGLIGLVTLSLGWIGVYYLGRRWLTLERPGAALLKCIGYSSRELMGLLMIKLAVILVTGVALGGVLSYAGAHAVFPLFKDSLPAEFELIWSWWNTVLLLIIGPLAGMLLLYAPMHACAYEKPLSLLNANPVRVQVSWKAIVALTSSVALLFVALTFMQARSWMVSGVFLGALISCTALICGAAFAALRLAGVMRTRTRGWRWHLVSAQWVGRPGTAILLVAVSALAGLLAQLVPHLESTIVGDIRPPDRTARPALFLFDVQDEQLNPLKEWLRENETEVSQASPFIRSRLLKVNNEDFERRQTGSWSTREEETEARFRNRGVNLSYRAELSPSEKILRGKTWDELGENDISIEKDYAERLGFKLGDKLLFDVQGVEIPATVASIRQIDWDSFEPNFFVQFKPGVLGDAPKTWIVTVKRNPKHTAPQLQRLITQKFPNVSSINVEEALDNVTSIVTKLSGGLKVASRLAMALGVFVFLMILLFQLLSSRQDWVQLRVQGLTPGEIWTLQLSIFGGLALFGTAMGTLLAAGANWGLARFAFETAARFDAVSMVLILMITWALAAVGLTWISLTQAGHISRNLRSMGVS